MQLCGGKGAEMGERDLREREGLVRGLREKGPLRGERAWWREGDSLPE